MDVRQPAYGPEEFALLPPELRRQVLDLAKEHQDELTETLEKEERAKRIAAQKQFAYEQEEGRRQARAEREEAEIGGDLAPDAELFRELRLKPRISEAHDFEVPIRTPIVDDLFFRNSLTWVAGTSGTFKSFVTADLAFRYGADDMDYHGRLMTHGRALLVIAEGAEGYAHRKVAWEKQHDREIKNVSIYPAPLQLGDTLKEMPALRSYLEEERDAGRPFDLVLFDTQAMCTVGVDENTSEMNLVINILHRIREVNGACVMVVHHFGKNKNAGMRGSSMIYAAADTVCVLKRKDDALDVTLSTAQADEGKQKDAITESDFLTLEMVSHPVGKNYFDKTVFSLVPVAVEGGGHEVHDDPEGAPTSLTEIHVTDKQMPYLRALSYYREHGEKPTAIAKKMMDDGVVGKTYGSLVRSTMIGLEDRNLVSVDRDGRWRIAALGTAVLLREQSARAATEEAWSTRPTRRFRSEVSEGQENINLKTFETSENLDPKRHLTSDETPET